MNRISSFLKKIFVKNTIYSNVSIVTDIFIWLLILILIFFKKMPDEQSCDKLGWIYGVFMYAWAILLKISSNWKFDETIKKFK